MAPEERVCSVLQDLPLRCWALRQWEQATCAAAGGLTQALAGLRGLGHCWPLLSWKRYSQPGLCSRWVCVLTPLEAREPPNISVAITQNAVPGLWWWATWAHQSDSTPTHRFHLLSLLTSIQLFVGH